MTGDSAVREIFNMLVDFFAFIVSQMKRIPTGFGVDLYTFCIACLITGVVLVGIVNVVKTNSSSDVLINIHSDYKSRKRPEKRKAKDERRKYFEGE